MGGLFELDGCRIPADVPYRRQFNVPKKLKKTAPQHSPASDREPDPDALEVEVLPPEIAVMPEAGTGESIEPEVVIDAPSFEELSLEELPEDVEVQEAGPRDALVPYNPLDAYLAEIRRFKPLSREEEHEVAVEYYKTKSPESAYRLVSGNLWLAVKIARDYERVARSILDLIQEGNIGLMEAVKNFDPYRGVRFPSYAVWWIRAYIIRYIIANWRLVKIGTTQAQRKLFFNLKKESDRLEREGIFPTPKLLAERLNVREGDVVEMSQRLSGSDVSIDAPLQDDNDSNLLSVLPSERESVEDAMAKREVHAVLRGAIIEFNQSLSAKERAIFKGRVLDDDKLTLQELSDELSLSKERVRQIENKLREKLRLFVSNKLGSELGDWVDTQSQD
jgi:RNA polymerase sigma-32 factor